MFVCQQCGQQVDRRVHAIHLIVEKRDREYTQPDGHISRGWEIVREIIVGPCCKPSELDRDSVNREIGPPTRSSAVPEPGRAEAPSEQKAKLRV